MLAHLLLSTINHSSTWLASLLRYFIGTLTSDISGTGISGVGIPAIDIPATSYGTFVSKLATLYYDFHKQKSAES